MGVKGKDQIKGALVNYLDQAERGVNPQKYRFGCKYSILNNHRETKKIP